MKQAKSKFELLRSKSIIAILDGDKDFGSLMINGIDSGIKISMPYLSGPMLCAISNNFGLPATYDRKGGAKSRWEYLDDLLIHCIRDNRESDLLAFLFSKQQFEDKLKGRTAAEVESAYKQIVTTIIDQINGELCFGGNELIKTGAVFTIRKSGTSIILTTPTIKMLDRNYIADISGRAMKDVTDGNYDSAITKSRTLLEEVFCYVIEKKGEAPTESGDIGKLYNQVKLLYRMHQNADLDKRINGLLSGLEKILSAIAEMRNKGSDAHGVGKKRININDYHARLFVNSAMTMADFILAVSEHAVQDYHQPGSDQCRQHGSGHAQA